MENELKNLRNIIDNIDNDLLELFVKRLDIVEKIFKYKISHGFAVYDSEREAEVMNKIANHNSAKSYKNEVQSFFKSIMNISKTYQEKQLGEEKCQR